MSLGEHADGRPHVRSRVHLRSCRPRQSARLGRELVTQVGGGRPHINAPWGGVLRKSLLGRGPAVGPGGSEGPVIAARLRQSARRAGSNKGVPWTPFRPLFEQRVCRPIPGSPECGVLRRRPKQRVVSNLGRNGEPRSDRRLAPAERPMHRVPEQAPGVRTLGAAEGVRAPVDCPVGVPFPLGVGVSVPPTPQRVPGFRRSGRAGRRRPWPRGNARPRSRRSPSTRSRSRRRPLQ